jgi:choline dehydrogenase-like flavoprotein
VVGLPTSAGLRTCADLEYRRVHDGTVECGSPGVGSRRIGSACSRVIGVLVCLVAPKSVGSVRVSRQYPDDRHHAAHSTPHRTRHAAHNTQPASLRQAAAGRKSATGLDTTGGWKHETHVTAGTSEYRLLASSTEPGAATGTRSAHSLPRLRAARACPLRCQLRSADPSDHPIVDPNYLDNPHDLEALSHGLRMARDLLKSSPLSHWKGLELSPGPWVGDSVASLSAHVRRQALSYYHPVGSCGLGRVVDSEQKVVGLANVRIADASVIPHAPHTNTMVATMIIGRQAADAILRSSKNVPGNDV